MAKGEMLQSLGRSVNQKVQEIGIYFPFLLDKLLIVPEPVLLHEMFKHSCNCPLELHFRIQNTCLSLKYQPVTDVDTVGLQCEQAASLQTVPQENKRHRP